jgi:hypothetical protein
MNPPRQSGVFRKVTVEVPPLDRWDLFQRALRFAPGNGEAYLISTVMRRGSSDVAGFIVYVVVDPGDGTIGPLLRWIGRGRTGTTAQAYQTTDLFADRADARKACQADLAARIATRANPPGEGMLPLPVVYTAVGILVGKKDFGQIKRVPKAEMSRAIRIATSRRQAEGLLAPGTRDLTPAGELWVAEKRRKEPLTIASHEEEFERLVGLRHAAKEKPPGKAAARGAVR